MADPTVADVIAMADTEHFKTFEAAARKFLGDAMPANKPGILEALKALPEDAAPTDPLDHDGDGKKGGAKKLPETLTVFLDYDTWIDDVRIKALKDAPQALPYERARQLLNEGKARRADPLPGE